MVGEKSKPAPFKLKAVPSGSRKAVGAVAEEGEKAYVPEDLELLADFVADVGVLGMKFCEGVGVGVNVGESEFEFS